MIDYIIKLPTEQLSGSITYVNSPDLPSSPTLEVEDFWQIRLKKKYNSSKSLILHVFARQVVQAVERDAAVLVAGGDGPAEPGPRVRV